MLLHPDVSDVFVSAQWALAYLLLIVVQRVIIIILIIIMIMGSAVAQVVWKPEGCWFDLWALPS